MDQVSAPIRIALVAVLAISALWFVALRPKPADEVSAAPGAPPVAVDPAPEAAAPTDAAAAPVRQAAGETPAPSAERDLATPLLRDLRDGRAVVVLFAARGADDRAARSAVRGIDRRDGRVSVKVASIGDVSRYEEITTGVRVAQAPTTLVIGPDRQATAIVGYTDVAEVEQAVGDALRRKG